MVELLALCSALTLNVLPGSGAPAHANAIEAAVGLGMSDCWELTAEGYLNHVPKAQIIQVLKEAGPGWCRGDEEGCIGGQGGVAAGRHALAA